MVNKKIIGFILACLIICTPFVSKFNVEAENVTYEEFIAVETEKSYDHPEYFIGSKAIFNIDAEYTSYQFINVVDGAMQRASVFVHRDELIADDGKGIVVKIVDYFFQNTALYFKVEAAEGYTLPESVANHPYTLQYFSKGEEPSLLMLPKQAVFIGDTVSIKSNPVAASKYEDVNTATLPDFFEIKHVISTDGTGSDWLGYDIGTIYNETYRYVDESAVQLIPIEVVNAYEKLMSTTTREEYNAVLDTIDPNVIDQFTTKHKQHVENHEDGFVIADAQEAYQELISATTTTEYYEIYDSLSEDIIAKLEELFSTELENHLNELIRLDNIEYTKTVTINGRLTNIRVKGRIPEGAELYIQEVPLQTLKDEGFDLSKMTELIFSADIKIMYEGMEWQPDPETFIELSIDVDSEKYPDGTVLQLHHKHEQDIYKYDIFVVIDGKITYFTNEFSIYVVNDTDDTYSSENIGDGGTVTLSVDNDDTVLYNTQGNNRGTWRVEDPNGAIYYEVHSNSGVGHGGVKAPWIKIIPLKETNGSPIILRYYYGTNNNNSYEEYKLNIVPPTAGSSGKALYIKDTVNTTGCITATVVDSSGTIISNGLDGAKITWTRKDGSKDVFITPQAYSTDFRSVNIAVDHAGLVEGRRNTETQDLNDFDLVTYTASVILADGTALSADYTVYYQSEILNANFESIPATNSNYSFFVNGYPGLYWKTTAPGTGDKLTMDVEIGDVTNGTANGNGQGTGFGLTRAADHGNGDKAVGVQFAELNAEAFGSLYQDIITAPDEDIEWEFSHAPRQDQTSNNNGWATHISNAMYIVIGPTEEAQKLTTQTQLEALGTAATNAANSLSTEQKNLFNSGKLGINVTYNDTVYKVWYHDAGTINQDGTAYRKDVDPTSAIYSDPDAGYGWTDLAGLYTVPENQYRTRLFFVSKPSSTSSNKNAGNLIDRASAGQYKSYLIEYYEESYDKSGRLVVNHLTDYDQKGEALIYSSVIMTGLNKVEQHRQDFLHTILINGTPYPYDIKYTGTPSIYVQKYPGTATDPFTDVGTPYTGYDIVVQVYVRDTVIAIQKEVVFPNELTTVQKLNIIQGLPNGYEAQYNIYCPDPLVQFSELQNVSIKSPNPDGSYTGYVSQDNNPTLEHSYYIEEKNMSVMPGLRLSKVKYDVVGYKYGTQEQDFIIHAQLTHQITFDENGNITSGAGTGDKIISPEIFLSTDGYKIADVTVTNYYEEKDTTIIYKALGNGKLAWFGTTNFVDEPTETIKYYSELADGCDVFAGKGARFVGWYKEVKNADGEVELVKVTSVDGVWDKNTNSFRPNANILNADTVTFYAKFETNSIVIEREDGEENQTFVYHIEGYSDAARTNKVLDTYVSITCDDEGNGYKEILEVTAPYITVTEIPDWSWRFTDGSKNTRVQKDDFVNSDTPNKLTFTFDEDYSIFSKEFWINGYSEIKKNYHKLLEESHDE